jgi:hypothetical protein
MKNPYQGYESEGAYIAAFKGFLKEKEYFETDMQLMGFYGTKTMELLQGAEWMADAE